MPGIQVISYAEATGALKAVYDSLIEKRGKLAAVHTIQSLNPQSIVAHMDLYMAVMFGQSPLTRAQREMIAVVVSVTNDCAYCQLHHVAALTNYWKDEERVRLLKKNPADAGLTAADSALCRFAAMLTRQPGLSGQNEPEILRESGFSDRAILDATLVVAYFNFVNRIVLALGVEPEENAGEGYIY